MASWDAVEAEQAGVAIHDGEEGSCGTLTSEGRPQKKVWTLG
jgi:hypothetical protein